MNGTRSGWKMGLATATLLLSGAAQADWLAVDPGTQISLQINTNGTVVVRPIGGTWSHPLCSDVTAAILWNGSGHQNTFQLILPLLITAAADGSLVNLYASDETCNGSGLPLVTAARIQAP